MPQNENFKSNKWCTVMVEFKLDYKITAKISSNAIYSGVHWSRRKKDADTLHLLVKQAIRSQLGFKKCFDCPVIVEIYVKSRLDIYNHGYISKLIIDGMKGELIHDDTKKYVQGLCVWFLEDSNENDIIVQVSEVE